MFFSRRIVRMVYSFLAEALLSISTKYRRADCWTTWYVATGFRGNRPQDPGVGGQAKLCRRGGLHGCGLFPPVRHAQVPTAGSSKHGGGGGSGGGVLLLLLLLLMLLFLLLRLLLLEVLAV